MTNRSDSARIVVVRGNPVDARLIGAQLREAAGGEVVLAYVVAGRPACVLLIDDDDALRFLAAEVIAQLDATVDVVLAADGEAALAVLAQRDVDLVLVDQRLPRQAGTEVHASARALGYTMPFALMTGADDGAELARKAGVEFYLEKPFGRAALAHILSVTLRRQ